MKRCGKCREPYRVGCIAHVMGERGKLTRVRVCPKCAKLGVLVLAAQQAPSCTCGKPAKFCAACATNAERKDKAADVSKAIVTMKGWLRIAEGADPKADGRNDYMEGRASGLTSAIELLESGRF